MLVRGLDLDIKEDPQDLQLLQFQSLVFNKILEHYERLCQDPTYSWNWQDAYYAADAMAKAYSSYNMWRRATGYGQDDTAKYWFIEFLRRLATALIQELKRGR